LRALRAAWTMASVAAVLFCPFCREAHEGIERCPEHDLLLLPWHELPRAAPDSAALDVALERWSPRYGRGLFASGLILMAISFLFFPLGTAQGEVRLGGTMIALAAAGSARLWLVGAALALQVALLARRRTPRSMRAARLAAAITAVVPCLAAGWAYVGAIEATAILSEGHSQAIELSPGAGLYGLALGALLGVLGAFRLGSAPAPRKLV
jgi:hypothetical protein